MNIQQLDHLSSITSNKFERSVHSSNENWNGNVLLLETDNLAYEEDYQVIDDHIRNFMDEQDY